MDVLYLSISLFKSDPFVFSFLTLRMILQETSFFMYLNIHVYFLWYKLSGGTFLDQGKWISSFHKYAWSLSIGVVILHIFVFSAWVTGTTVLFNVFQSDKYKVITSFSLCFPHYWWVWASFHKLVGYLSLYFSDLPIQILFIFSFSCQFMRHLLYAL